MHIIPTCMKKRDGNASDSKKMEQLRTPCNMKRNGDKSKQILGKPKGKKLKDIDSAHSSSNKNSSKMKKMTNPPKMDP